MKLYNEEFSLRKPFALKKGDTIGIVAPSGPYDPIELQRGIDFFKSLDYEVIYEGSIFNKHWSLAKQDKEKAFQINRMFSNQIVKAIFCATGGYGSIRTLPFLNETIIKNNPKIFVGYSDITILLLYLYKTARMVLFHGPVVSGEIHQEMNWVTFDYLKKVIETTSPLGEIRSPSMETLKPGRASGLLIGGNLSLIINSIGTPYEINTKNSILFLEDIAESLEVIDNYLMQLKLAGKLKKIKGIIFGKMVNCPLEPSKEFTIRDLIKDTLSDIDVPIVYGLPSGHLDEKEIHITLPLGVNATLDGYRSSLIINESAVS
ncbi:MAG: LD-carboxypeptidase [Oligoflexia bacterium]|nr:LD-carboxypeptidase [Oligoflexia bacterium]